MAEPQLPRSSRARFPPNLASIPAQGSFRSSRSSARRKPIISIASAATALAIAGSSRRAPEPVLDEAALAERRKDVLRASKAESKEIVCKSVREVLQDFSTDAERGLTEAEAKSRLDEVGRNELAKDPKKPTWVLFLEQFEDLLVIMLIVAAIVSAIMEEYEASIVIVAILIFNAILGLVQETKAEKALESLQALSGDLVDVIRDGLRKTIEGTILVPGDIVVLETGKKIAADMRVVQAQQLITNEMVLTGESEGVRKDAAWVGVKEDQPQPIPESAPAAPEEKKNDAEEKKKDADEKKKEAALTAKNMVYMASSVQEGTAKCVVVKTGMLTQVGKIAELIKTADESDTPLQIKLDTLGKYLGIASILISLIVLLVGGLTRGAWMEMILVSISLVVAAVPEGLPACVTITLAIGMRKMLEQNALVRKLKSVETLGSASVICTDKTGTLTMGVMTAVQAWFNGQMFQITGRSDVPEGLVLPIQVNENKPDEVKAALESLQKMDNAHSALFLIGALACSSNASYQKDEKTGEWTFKGPLTERPVIVAARKMNFAKEELDKRYPRKAENPFNSSRKMMSTLVECANPHPQFSRISHLGCVKGAPNIMLEKAKYLFGPGGSREITQDDRKQILDVIDKCSSEALRVLAVAYRPFDELPSDTSPEALEKDLTLVGLLASIDPERTEVKGAIFKAAMAGIRTVMITGDYVLTARAIGMNVGILPKNAAEDKAVDCDNLRKLGFEIDRLEKQIEQLILSKAPSAAIAEATAAKNAVELQVDAITCKADVYARAQPLDKITIVRSLQRQGQICSMTGDGVNDAPALKQANIGVAMGKTGTDVAKAASCMVLLDDNFATIVKAIEQGRLIYSNIQKFVFYLMSTNVSEVLVVFILTIAGYPIPLTAIQILWLNLTTDGAPAIALALENSEPGLMDDGPRPATEPILEKVLVTGAIIQNCVLTGMCCLIFIIVFNWRDGPHLADIKSAEDLNNEPCTQVARTMLIVYIVFAELLRSYGARSLRVSMFTLGVFSNKFLQYGVGVAIALTFFVVYVPGVRTIFDMHAPLANGEEWLLTLLCTFVPLAVDEITKCIYRAVGFGRRPKAQAIGAVLIAQQEAEKAAAAPNAVGTDLVNVLVR